MAAREGKQAAPAARDGGAAGAPELLEVVLKREHQHGALRYPAGAVIQVSARQKDWLAAQGVV